MRVNDIMNALISSQFKPGKKVKIHVTRRGGPPIIQTGKVGHINGSDRDVYQLPTYVVELDDGSISYEVCESSMTLDVPGGICTNLLGSVREDVRKKWMG